MKRAIILIYCFLYLAGCSNSGNQNTSSSPSATLPNSSVTPITETLQPKELPVLGDSATQLQFKVDEAQAVIENKARPTYPPTLAVLAGNPPEGTDVCNLSYSALIKAMYEKCLLEGMGYISMSNLIGWAGEEISRSDDTVIYKWGSGEQGILTATFVNGRLTAKSQMGLK